MAVVLKWFGKECEKQILSATEQAVLKGCYMIEGDTKTSMKPGSGREYKRPGGKIHRASAPGQPPAVDYGRLINSIAVNWSGSGLPTGKVTNPKQSGDGVSMPPTETGKFTGRVGTNVEYACLKAMTDVLTNKGWKRISLIKVGDLVLTQTGEYHKVLERIKIKNTERPDMVTIEVNWRKYFIRKLMMTKEHKILIYREGRNKWVQAKDLLNTDQVFCTPKISSNKGISIYKDVLFNIKKITNWEYKVEPKGKQKGIRTAYLYDLSIEGVHSYYANGVLVSNSHLEFGTVKMGPRPYLRPAFEKNISKIRNLFNNLIK